MNPEDIFFLGFACYGCGVVGEPGTMVYFIKPDGIQAHCKSVLVCEENQKLAEAAARP